MYNKEIFKKLKISILMPLTFLLVYVAGKTPYLVENLYSQGVYLPIGRILSNITGILPFSVAEAAVAAVPIFFLAYTLRMLAKMLDRKSKDFQIFAEYAVNTLAAISIAFFVFIIIWGLNYYRLPFAALADLEVKPASAGDLEKVCKSLVERANTLRASVSIDSAGNVDIPGSSRDILNNCYKGYQAISGKYSYLGGSYGNPKPVLLSKFMNYTGICGVYFPYTAEANVNVAIPDMILPSTASHEMAHQRGFAREDEANYISYLACTAHPDINFRYSGIILALTNATNALYKSDPSLYHEVAKGYSDEVRKDLATLSRFWAQYEGPVERTSSRMNNAYLKANNQKDGVRSYGRMVDLLIAEYKKDW